MSRTTLFARGGGRSVLALALLLGGCRVGTDLPSTDPEPLLPQEAQAVVAAIVSETLAGSVYSDVFGSFAHSHGSASVHTHPISGPFTHDVGTGDGPELSHHNLFQFDHVDQRACATSGSVLYEAAVTGEGDPRAQRGNVHFVMIQTHDDCAISPGGPDGLLVFRGDPYLSVEAHAVNDGTTVSVYGLVQGHVAWQAEAKAGSCEIDITFAAEASTMAEIAVFPVSGTFCGEDLSLDVPRG